MLEPVIKENRRYLLEVNGERTRLSTKAFAIKMGKFVKRALAKGEYVKLIEEYDIFDISEASKPKHIDHREFDRSILLEESSKS